MLSLPECAGLLGSDFVCSGRHDAALWAPTQAKSQCLYQTIKREFLGTCAIKNAIWSARMRRLRKMKSSHKLGT